MEVKKLICDVCGGQIEMQSGGRGVCTSCGTPYSAEIVKEKIQQIRGTVKVDGPVETVKGDAEKERLLNMANDCLNKGNIEEAKRIYKRVSQEYSNDWRGWWGIICSTPLNSNEPVVCEQNFNSLEYEYKMAISFAPEKFKQKIISHRQQTYSQIRKTKSSGEDNAKKLKSIFRKHNYRQAFEEVIRSHINRGSGGVIYVNNVEEYIGNSISWRDDEFRHHIWNASINISSDNMEILEREAIEKHNSYIEKHLCPLCYNHRELNIFGRCKIHGKVKLD